MNTSRVDIGRVSWLPSRPRLQLELGNETGLTEAVALARYWKHCGACWSPRTIAHYWQSAIFFVRCVDEERYEEHSSHLADR